MKPARSKYDAVIVGSGPNGLAAAITLQHSGLKTLVLEGLGEAGGGLRTLELTLPGFKHDICSSIHPMTLQSPFFQSLPLEEWGVEWIWPPVPAAHSIDFEHAVGFHRSLDQTAKGLGEDEKSYRRLMSPLVENLDVLVDDFLGPLKFPGHPWQTSRFGLKALQSAQGLVQRRFNGGDARALFAGMAAHTAIPLNYLASAAPALVLMAAGHRHGWPFPKGGARHISLALINYYRQLGGELITGYKVENIEELAFAGAYLMDTSPRALLNIAGNKLPGYYKRQLRHYEYGAGVFKIDWALDRPIPFTDKLLCDAGTIHLGGSFADVAAGEYRIDNGKLPQKPFILLAQHSRFDETRAPEGKHTAWAYCHVPHNSGAHMLEAIQGEIEKVAPGFKKTVLGYHCIKASEFSSFNPNIVGGDINNGKQKFSQIFTRPAFRVSPYSTPAKGIYICSAATPPGGGVHGMCGFHAAKKVMSDLN